MRGLHLKVWGCEVANKWSDCTRLAKEIRWFALMIIQCSQTMIRWCLISPIYLPKSLIYDFVVITWWYYGMTVLTPPTFPNRARLLSSSQQLLIASASFALKHLFSFIFIFIFIFFLSSFSSVVYVYNPSAFVCLFVVWTSYVKYLIVCGMSSF